MTDDKAMINFCKRIAGLEKEVIKHRRKEKPRTWSLRTINGVQVLVPGETNRA